MSIAEHVSINRNFRDAGKQISADLSGKIYRMGKLFNLGEEERSFLEQLKISDVLDLRSESERIAEPDTPINARFHHIDFSGGLLGLDQVVDVYRQAARDPESVDASEYIRESYRRIPEVCTDQVREAFDVISSSEEKRVLIHCAGGKDRTGFLTALLLKLAGVDDQNVIAEYMLSKKSESQMQQILQRYLKKYAEIGIDIPVEVAEPFLTVHEDSMRALLENIHEGYESVDGYLMEAARVPEKQINEIRAWLSG
jgi:protein-tyrosine phosphatase